ARVRLVSEGGWPIVSWSDYFDFHPTGVATDGSLYTHTPALKAFFIPERNFQAMPSPTVAVGTPLGVADPFLNRNLGRLWRRRFVHPGKDALPGRIVFRSLEIAYHAAAVGNRNESSLHDYGLQIALWVTALEVLARPPRGHVSQTQVLALI